MLTFSLELICIMFVSFFLSLPLITCSLTTISSSLRFLSLSESGKLTLESINPAGEYKYFHFSTTYSTPFASTPRFMFMIRQYYNSNPLNQQVLWAHNLPSSNTTSPTLQIYFFNVSGWTVNSLLSCNYFATTDPNILTINTIMDQQNSHRLFGSVTTSFPVDSPLVYKECFLSHFSFFIHNVTPNKMDQRCIVRNGRQNVYDVEVTLTATIPNTGRYFRCYSVFIKDVDLMGVAKYGLYKVDTQNTFPLDVDTSGDMIFLIGLYSFNLPTTNIFEIGLDESNKQISSRTVSFNQIGWNYLHAKKFKLRDFNITVLVYLMRSKVKFWVNRLGGFEVVAGDLPRFGGPLEYSEYRTEGTVDANIKGEITQTPVYGHFKFLNFYYEYIFNFQIKIFSCPRVFVDYSKGLLSVFAINVAASDTIDSFEIDDLSFRITSYDRMSNDISQINIESQNLTTQQFIITCSPENQDTKHRIVIPVLYVKRVKVSAKTNVLRVIINKLEGHIYAANNFKLSSSSVNDLGFAVLNDGSVKGEMEYHPTTTTDRNPIEISYVPDPVTKFEIVLKFMLMIVKHVEVEVNSSKAKIVWANIAEQNVESGDFTISGGASSIESVSKQGNLSQVILDSSGYIDGDQFQIIYSSSNFLTYQTIASNIYYYKSSTFFNNFTFDRESNNFNITLTNVENLLDISNIFFRFVSPKATIKSVALQSNHLILICEFLTTIQNQKLSLEYQSDQTTLFKHLITISLYEHNSLIFCDRSESLSSRGNIIYIISMTIASLYLLVFFISIISCKKILGIELIFLIQLAFYSLLPINIFCHPFKGLQGLKYASGLIPFSLFDFEEVYLRSNYSSMGIKSSFLSNVNVLLAPLLIAPLFYFPIKYIGERSNDIHTKPRCKRYGKSLLFEAPFVILLFNSLNIYSSLSLNVQHFNPNNIISFAASILISLFLPLFIIIFLKYNSSFVEFRNEFQDYYPLYSISKQKSNKIRRLYPLLLALEFILVPSVLFVQSLFGFSYYLVLGLEVLITILVAVFPLYPTRIQNIRNYLHRAIVILIVGVQTITFKFRNQGIQEDNFVYLMPLMLLGLLSLGFIIDGGFIILQSIKFWRAPKLVDGLLKIRLIAMRQKPIDYVPLPEGYVSLCYPRSEFKPFRPALISALPKLPIQAITNINNYNYVEKYLRWFRDIKEKDLCHQLHLDKEDFGRLQQANPDKYQVEMFINSLFSHINLVPLLIDFHDTIVDIEDIMEFSDNLKTNSSFREEHAKYLNKEQKGVSNVRGDSKRQLK